MEFPWILKIFTTFLKIYRGGGSAGGNKLWLNVWWVVKFFILSSWLWWDTFCYQTSNWVNMNLIVKSIQEKGNIEMWFWQILINPSTIVYTFVNVIFFILPVSVHLIGRVQAASICFHSLLLGCFHITIFFVIPRIIVALFDHPNTWDELTMVPFPHNFYIDYYNW